MRETTKQRMREREPKPLARSDKENLSGSLLLYWNRDAKHSLKILFPEYLKLLEGLFESSLYRREAWVCRMFRERKFDQLFSEPDQPNSTEGGRKQSLDYLELLDRILLASRALRKFSKNLRNETSPRHRGRLSAAEINLVKQRFKELTHDEKHPLSHNLAYEQIATELKKWERPKEGKTTIRRICDENFAKKTGCVYGTQKEEAPPKFDPKSLPDEKPQEPDLAWKEAIALLSPKEK